MSRLSVRLAAALLTFTAGVVAATAGRGFFSRPAEVAPTPAGRERTYIPGDHFDAPRGALQTFSSSDGRSFKKWTITCGSPRGARRRMEELLRKSERVVSREPVLDAGGREAGEEVVAVFAAADAENGPASLFRVGRTEYLIQITASSPEHILDYRSDFERRSSRPRTGDAEGRVPF